MPKRAPSPCNEPGCAALCYGTKDEYRGRCPEHAKPLKAAHQRRQRQTRKANTRQRELDSFYSTPEWRKLRAAYIARNPLCTMCSAVGRTVAADVVDHIHERRDGGADLDSSNLQSLCHACHNDKTQQERRRRIHGNIR